MALRPSHTPRSPILELGTLSTSSGCELSAVGSSWGTFSGEPCTAVILNVAKEDEFNECSSKQAG